MIDAGAFRVAGAPGGVAAMACAAVCPMSWHLPRFLPGMQAKVPAQARQRVLAEKLFLPGTPEAPALPEKKMNVDGRIVKMRPWTVSGGVHEQKLIRSSSSFTHLEDGLSRIPLQPGNPGFPAPVKSRNPRAKAPHPRKTSPPPGRVPPEKHRCRNKEKRVRRTHYKRTATFPGH